MRILSISVVIDRKISGIVVVIDLRLWILLFKKECEVCWDWGYEEWILNGNNLFFKVLRIFLIFVVLLGESWL